MVNRAEEIGKAIVQGGFTWSDGHLRESHTVAELAQYLDEHFFEGKDPEGWST